MDVDYEEEDYEPRMFPPCPCCRGSCEDGRCQKCGGLTNGEEAYIDGQTWCHTCADEISDNQQLKHK